MSHEIKTPMNSTINMIRESMTLMKDEKGTEFLNQAIASSNDLLSVINTILEISNIESGKLILSSLPFKMSSVITDINSVISILCKAKGVLWEPKVSSAAKLTVEGDRIRLLQALTILLRNAVKYASEQEGKVSCAMDIVTETDEAVCICFKVADNGIGISEKNISEFSQMFSKDNNHIHYSSSEIMLSACSSIIQAMGSQIMVESNPGIGSCFSFFVNFPKAIMPVQPEEIDLNNVDFTGKHVLIVDDVGTNRLVLKNLLKKTGIEFIEAVDGSQAVTIFSEKYESISVILMDVMMPNMDGYEATHKIRASGLPNALTVPIIAVTALSYQEDVETALNAGMNFHLEKPVIPETLLNTLVRFIT
jgi:CheY-like chemotaxis protein